MAAPDKAAREALLEELWTETARAYLTLLKNTEPAEITAALLTSIRQFLTDQGINHQSIGGEKERQRDTAQQIAGALSELDLDEDDLRSATEGVREHDRGAASGDEGPDLPVPGWPVRLEDK